MNDAPHIGHAFTTVFADAVSRYFRLKGEAVHFLTGTDEHGQKIARTAAARGLTPRQLVDEVVKDYRRAWGELGISHDDFIRTTEPRHFQAVRAFLELVNANGDVYKARYEGLYCVACEAYYQSDELTPGGLCPVHGTPVEELAEDNYFFRLSRYAEPLLAHIEAHPSFVYPESRRNEVVGHIRQGLMDLSISRAQLAWGIPLPWDPSHVTYVWVEALINYVSATGFPAPPYQRLWPPWAHLVGKDILRFHAVIWPALLMSAGLALPRQIAAHGWLLVGGEKMSKTRANQISPHQLIADFGTDGYRYHFLRDTSFGPDSSFSWEGMLDRYNADLANDFGNLVNRVLTMVDRYQGSQVTPVSAGFVPEARLRAAAEAATQGMAGFEEFRVGEALAGVWRLFAAANAYVEVSEPWKLHKAGEAERLGDVLNGLLECLRVGAILVSPAMPAAAAELWSRLGLPGRPDVGPLAETAHFGTFPPTKVRTGSPLFPRIEA